MLVKSGVITILEVRSGKVWRQYRRGPMGGAALAFSPDGRTLASEGPACSILLSDVTGPP